MKLGDLAQEMHHETGMMGQRDWLEMTQQNREVAAMQISQALSPESKEHRYARRRRRYAAGGLGVGAACAGAVGAIAAGVPGAVVGAVIGSVMGGMTAWALRSGTDDDAIRDSQLDIDIGVTSGDLGVEGLKHPPAKIGAFSKEAAGAGGSTEPHSASGPFLRPPE